MKKKLPANGSMQILLISRIGFWAALLSAILYLCFDIAAIAGMTGILESEYWISISWYAPSLFLALTFVIMMVCIHYFTPKEYKVLSHIGLSLAIIYATLNCFIYIIQVLVIAPSMLNGQFENVALFEMAPDKPLYAVNALAYSLMGLSTLFSAFLFRGKGLSKWIKLILILHGAVAPTVVGAFIWPQLFFISATVGFTYPVAAILIALFFRQLSHSYNLGS